MSDAVRRLRYDELDDDLRAALAPRVERLGYLGEFFALAGHQPAALLAFHRFTEALKEALPAEVTEAVALTVATELSNDYERCQHERLALRLGFDRQWIAAAGGRAGSDPAALGPAAACARRLALAMVARHGHDVAAELDDAVRVLGERDTIGVTLLVARYTAHATVANAFAIQPPVGSVFDEPVGGG
ncbi:hypothetical protein [Actinomadura rugatobispora]|uniref:Carboxymuconolactone decarboxylase family protein n=1 Tax=Actinomadura rugatobispora TaxID=1994 RepID=A0ABW0ZSG4_9ACTN|nr:hypothetical protein GCM10010200_001630 [Actinomadura rugatobispora]